MCLVHGVIGVLGVDMALDTSIYNALMAPQKSVMDYANDYEDRAAKREQRDMLRQQNALQLQTLRDTSAEKQRGLAEKNALADFYRQGVPDLSNPETQAKLYQVAPSLADSVLKTHGEMRERNAKTAKEEAETIKSSAEAEKTKLATSYMMRDRHLQALGGIQDLQSASQWIQQGVQLGEFPPDQAQQIMGALQSGKMPLDQWKVNAQKGGMTIQQQAQDRMNQLELAVKQSNAAEQVRHNKASEGLMARGQNMTDARAREGLAEQRRANASVYDAERGLLVNKSTGEAMPVSQGGQPVGAKDKPLNDSQAKALLFGTRMQEAEKILGGFAKSGVNQPGLIKRGAESVPLVGGGLGSLLNFTQSDEQQGVEQAQQDFLNAVLRRESGAAIGKSEFESGKKQYFPQVGDSDAVIQQKARNRQLAINGILAEVPQSRPGQPAKRYNPATGRIE